MATESVDEILWMVYEAGAKSMEDSGGNDHEVKEAKQRLDAYYTRECARKVLEGRIDELERIEQWIAEHFLPEITIAENGDILLRIDNQIAELRAAIKDGAE